MVASICLENKGVLEDLRGVVNVKYSVRKVVEKLSKRPFLHTPIVEKLSENPT